MTDVKSYFDKHAHNHAYHKDPSFYIPLVNHLKRIRSNNSLRILDLGCGDGSFIKGMIGAGIHADFVGTDLSYVMVDMAQNNLNEYGTGLFVADGFNLPLQPDVKFDLIHIDSVLHHLIGKTRAESMRLTKQMIDLLVHLLSDSGALVVEEMYYASYLIPKTTSSVIFYGLKFLNTLHLDMSKILKEFQLGLEVNFLHDEEIESLLKTYGNNVT
ncbi:MAG TPA: class I SAM-dependent methyltransferase, partial [Nitrososphaeraceae archaeon]